MKNINLNTIKEETIKCIDSNKKGLIELSLKIHSNPELGYQEKKAAEWLCNDLKENGFKVKKGIAGLNTAFKAKYGNGSPVIAIFAEYDALPVIGHACGHNIIAASAVGAGIASKIIVDKLQGTVIVYGTPAEEVLGGKIDLIDNDEFKNVDVALITHPDTRNNTQIVALACTGIEIEYFGKAAHAAAEPELGINALDAIVLAFNNVNALRQHIQDKARIHGIITHGGNAANIIPDYSAANFLIRALVHDYLVELQKKVLDCFSGAALATGCQLKYKWTDKMSDSMKNNVIMAKLFASNMELLGRTVEPFNVNTAFGSTDMGNVSQIIPSIHPTVQIAKPGIAVHSKEFAQAAASKNGHKGLLDAAKAMAMTVVDIAGNPCVLLKIKEEFNRKTKQ